MIREPLAVLLELEAKWRRQSKALRVQAVDALEADESGYAHVLSFEATRIEDCADDLASVIRGIKERESHEVAAYRQFVNTVRVPRKGNEMFATITHALADLSDALSASPSLVTRQREEEKDDTTSRMMRLARTRTYLHRCPTASKGLVVRAMKVLMGCSLPRLAFQLSVPEDASDKEIVKRLAFVREWLAMTAETFVSAVEVPQSVDVADPHVGGSSE